MTGGTIKVRDKTEIISSDEIHYEMYMTGPDGKEFKAIENRMMRRK